MDPKGPRGAILSATHGPAEIEESTEAWRRALRMLKEEGELRHGAAAPHYPAARTAPLSSSAAISASA